MIEVNNIQYIYMEKALNLLMHVNTINLKYSTDKAMDVIYNRQNNHAKNALDKLNNSLGAGLTFNETFVLSLALQKLYTESKNYRNNDLKALTLKVYNTRKAENRLTPFHKSTFVLINEDVVSYFGNINTQNIRYENSIQ